MDNNMALPTFTPGTMIKASDMNSALAEVYRMALDAAHPVGSIYMSTTLATAADVEAALGGTWVAWGAGRVPVGVDTGDTSFDTVEETGGSKKHTHTIDARLRMWFGVAGMETAKAFDIIDENGNGGTMTQGTDQLSRTNVSRNNGAQAGTTTIAHDGFGQKVVGKTYSDSSLQPYITCYMYKRTA